MTTRTILYTRIPAKLRVELHVAAAQDERSISWCVEKAIVAWLAARTAAQSKEET